MKKYLSCFLILLALVLPLLGMEANAAEIVDSGTCGENLTWTLDNRGTLTISGSGDMFNYWNDSPWYAIRTAVKTVVIENGVTTIGNSAFEGCSRLESITIPDGVTAIGVCAFEHCSILVSIAIPDSVTTIGNYAFNGCGNLESITIPDCVTTIGNYAFNGCSDLESISIGDSVTTIAILHSKAAVD